MSIGPETLLLGLDGRADRADDVVPEGGGRRDRGRPALPGARVQLPERDRARAVRALPHRARARRASAAPTTPGGESFAFAPRVPPVPERLREIWWVRRMPQVVAGIALLAAIVLPLVVHQSAHHLTYSIILAFAICAVSVTVLTGWGGQLSLGQMAFAGIGALSGGRVLRGITMNIGWRSHRLVQRRAPAVPVRDDARARRRDDPARGHRVAARNGGRPARARDRRHRRRARAAAAVRRAHHRADGAAAALRARHLPRRARRVLRGGARRHRRAAREGPAPRDQHDGVRDRGARATSSAARSSPAAKARSPSASRAASSARST